MEDVEIKKVLDDCFSAFDKAEKEEEEIQDEQFDLEEEKRQHEEAIKLINKKIEKNRKLAEKKAKEKIDTAQVLLNNDIRVEVINKYKNLGVPEGKIKKLELIDRRIKSEEAEFEEFVTFVDLGNKIIIKHENHDMPEFNKASNTKDDDKEKCIENAIESEKINFFNTFFQKEEKK